MGTYNLSTDLQMALEKISEKEGYTPDDYVNFIMGKVLESKLIEEYRSNISTSADSAIEEMKKERSTMFQSSK